MSRRRQHEEEEEHTNHERWLVTYADMVTLLMVLFIVMFAISQVDQKKFAELRDGLAAGFGSQDSVLKGAESINREPGSNPVAPQLQLGHLSGPQRTLVLAALDRNAELERDRVEADAKNEFKRLDAVRKKLMAALRRAGLEDDVRASYDARGLVISLVSKHVTFRSDLADLTDRGIRIIDEIGRVLHTVADPIEVDGHTNQAPGRPKYYSSDWALSAARALTVLDRLEHVSRIGADRLSMAAFGHTRPLLDPDLPRSQAINKRVDIVVRARTGADASALLPQLDAERHRNAIGQDAAFGTGTGTDNSTDSPEVALPGATVPEGGTR